MEELRFGATINPNGSLRKIHILEKHGYTIICKKQHMHKVFNATYLFTYDTVPKNITFCKGCSKKSKYKKQIKIYLSTIGKNIIKNDYNYDGDYEDMSELSSDEEYVDPKSDKVNVNVDINKPVWKPFSLFSNNICCYYCNKSVNGSFVLHDNHIFHSSHYVCFDNYKKLKDPFEKTEDSKIYKSFESKNLTFLQWNFT